jgi:hypothetical protein
MKNKKVHTVKINLLTEKSLDLRNKLLFFALHYLRYIIVITQITVIMVFLYRFKIDQQIIDLREDVAQKQEILKVTAPLISEAQATQNRLTKIKLILSKQSSFTKDFDFVLSTIPEDTILNEVSIDGKAGVTIKGKAATVSSVRSIYEAIIKKGIFKNTNITDIGRSVGSQNFQFIIVARYE